MATSAPGPRRLYLFQVLAANVPAPDGPLAFSAGCYLVEMSDGKHVLIDSGFPADAPPMPGTVSTVTGRDVMEYLDELGLRPDDIDILICTHFHIDHVGFHQAFTNAELIVQREHDELARAGDERLAGARAHWDHPDLRYRLVDGDTELLPGLTLIKTSGHVAGHQSVLVRLPQTGPVLLAIDAVAMERLFTPDRRAWPVDEDEEQLRASTRKLLDLVEREQVSLVVFGHDGEQWQSLKKAPDYYE